MVVGVIVIVVVGLWCFGSVIYLAPVIYTRRHVWGRSLGDLTTKSSVQTFITTVQTRHCSPACERVMFSSQFLAFGSGRSCFSTYQKGVHKPVIEWAFVIKTP